MKTTANTLQIDGSKGEGGGQVLRTSLALSVITGQAFHITNIRANRRKPGLMRQHLACVKAAAEISGAELEGAELNSQDLQFRPEPGGARPGEYNFAIGSAGSTSMVLQAILPAMLMARGQFEGTIEGGTHNPMAPPFPFLEQVFVPLLQRMGAQVELTMEKPGFVPAGGGIIQAVVNGTGNLGSLNLQERGEVLETVVTAARAGGIPGEVVERELKTVAKRLTVSSENLLHRTISESDSPGNYITIAIKSHYITELFTGIGELGKRAETVANDAVDEARAYLAAGVPVGPHLADQLLLPMSLGAGGAFRTITPTLHTKTNMEVIKLFLPVSITAEEAGDGIWEILVAV